MEKLREFMIRRREELRLSQRDVAKAAGMNPGTIASIEAGKVAKAPTLDTLESLAVGLRIDADVLIDIARGRAPRGPSSEPGPALGFLNDLGDIAFPPTPDERKLIAEAEALSLYIGLFTEPGFWNQPPDVRRRLLRDVEGAIDETRSMYRLMGKELPNGS